jgi:hypothetical protein
MSLECIFGDANERQVSRHTRRVIAGHGFLQGGQPDNAGETDEATDGKNRNKGKALFGRSLNRPEQWHGHDVDAEIRDDVDARVAVEKGSDINTCAFDRLIPGQCNRLALKHIDEHVYDGEKGDGDQEHIGKLPQKVETRGSEDAQIEDQEGNFGHPDNDIIGDFSGIEKLLLLRSWSVNSHEQRANGLSELTLREPAKLAGLARSLI